MEITIERVHIDLDYDNNTNNHPRDINDLEISNLDYRTELKKTNLSNYADIIQYPIEWTYTFNSEEIKILILCSEIGMKTGRTKLFNEEIGSIIDRLNDNWKDGMWFFRFDASSPKDGMWEYPIWSAKQVIEKITTSKRAWNALLDSNNTIYFVKFDSQWDTKREFRVFIRKCKVTCISQYNPYDKSILSGQSNTKIKDTANKIIKYLEDTILPKIIPVIMTDNLTADLYVADDHFKIIEFNSFGYWQAAGSALFHWIKDKSKLYNEEGKVWIRIIK
jgi:hypothetical protein